VKLTAGRSIATDPDFYPRGALAFLQTQKPVLSSSGEVEAWHPLERWVLNQDAGGAIKGGGRVDLFVGSGLPAERIAGRMKHPGSLYVFIKKGAAASSPGTQRRAEEKETF
jgi:membrane-bound lytic murein transglycosylase A